MFGDIVDTFLASVERPDVDGCDLLGSEDGVVDAILCCWPEGDSLAAECFRDFYGAAEETDVSALLDAAHDVARSVFEGRDGFDIVASLPMVCG